MLKVVLHKISLKKINIFSLNNVWHTILNYILSIHNTVLNRFFLWNVKFSNNYIFVFKFYLMFLECFACQIKWNYSTKSCNLLLLFEI